MSDEAIIGISAVVLMVALPVVGWFLRQQYPRGTTIFLARDFS